MFGKQYPQINITNDDLSSLTRDSITSRTNFYFEKPEAPINVAIIYQDPEKGPGYIVRHVYTPETTNNAVRISEYMFATQAEAQDMLLTYLLDPLSAPYQPIRSNPKAKQIATLIASSWSPNTPRKSGQGQYSDYVKSRDRND